MNDKVKKTFLQMCVNHGAIKTAEINDILTPICEAYEVPVFSEKSFKDFIKEINKEIVDYNQKLTFITHPLSKDEYLIFSLTFETSAGKLQFHYTDAERFYFSKLLENLIKTENYGIPWHKVYDIASSLPDTHHKINKTRVQQLVQEWTQQGYFLEREDFLYFGPKMLVEYAPHIKTNYSEFVTDCPLCKKVVWWGVKCVECDQKLHDNCLKTYLIKQSNCPMCKKIWNTPITLTNK